MPTFRQQTNKQTKKQKTEQNRGVKVNNTSVNDFN